jgi:hypothetical protein
MVLSPTVSHFGLNHRFLSICLNNGSFGYWIKVTLAKVFYDKTKAIFFKVRYYNWHQEVSAGCNPFIFI